MNLDAHRAAEQAARQSYGKLIAYLAVRNRDVAAAEDALSEALAAALRVWPESGVPDSPQAWLLVAARRNLAHEARRRQTRSAAVPVVRLALEEAEDRMNDAAGQAFPDDRLKLMFACTHPAIDPALHAPLMLQTVLGLQARNIASAFLVAPEAMGQRLVRAKTKIRDAGIPFAVPEREHLPERLEGVLSAIYAAYGLAWDGLDGESDSGNALAEEAIWLGRALIAVLPDEPEAIGLLALMLYSQARRAARRDENGDYVPLEEQDTTLWNSVLNAEADALLRHAGTFNRFGPFQCHAAIQAVHAERARTGTTNWAALVTLYEGLVALRATVGALTSWAAIVGRALGATAGLAALDRLDDGDVRAYQPYWAVRAHLLAEAGDSPRAIAAYDRAIGLSESAPVRRFLQARRASHLQSASS